MLKASRASVLSASTDSEVHSRATFDPTEPPADSIRSAIWAAVRILVPLVSNSAIKSATSCLSAGAAALAPPTKSCKRNLGTSCCSTKITSIPLSRIKVLKGGKLLSTTGREAGTSVRLIIPWGRPASNSSVNSISKISVPVVSPAATSTGSASRPG